MNLAGVPPMSGFLGKTGLLQAGLADGSPLALVLVGAGVLTSLLTLYAVAKTWALAFWRSPEQAHELTAAMVDPDNGSPAERHGNHVHLGPVSFGPRDLETARSLHADEDPDRDLHQLLQQDALPRRLPLLMTGPAAVLVALSLTLTAVGGPFYGYTDRAAADLEDRTPYLTAVLPEEAP